MERNRPENEHFAAEASSRAEADIWLKNRALDVAAEGITISDMRSPEQPLIYINEGSERLTGYSSKSMIGKNCRFLREKVRIPQLFRKYEMHSYREKNVS